MDRYLYRAKEVGTEKWVEGFLMDENYINVPFDDDDACGRFDEPCEIDPETICQCTGKVDVHGETIWENDIVVFTDTYSTESGYSELDCIGKVVWDNETLSFQVTGRLSAESCEVLSDCSVLGNIFDNPELTEA